MAELICITGMDGTGKDTLIEKLEVSLKSVKIAKIWDSVDGAVEIPFKSKKDIDAYLCELSPDARLLFLAHALKFSIDLALKSGKEYILVNGYYFKYFATELALGAGMQLVHALMEIFPVPDKVICLTIDINEASKRKKKFSRYECGLSASPDQTSFLNFQARAARFWDVYDRTGWTVLSASQSPEIVFDRALQVIASVGK